MYVAAEGGSRAGFRVFPGGNGDGAELLGAGAYSLLDVEASPDGTVLLVTAASNTADAKVRRFTKDGKSLGTFSLPNISGIGVDSDCNIWTGDFTNRGITKYSPTGRRLATAAYTDLQAQDIAVAKNGDLYVTQLNGPIVHFTLDRSHPATASIPARLTVSTGTGGEDRVRTAGRLLSGPDLGDCDAHRARHLRNGRRAASSRQGRRT